MIKPVSSIHSWHTHSRTRFAFHQQVETNKIYNNMFIKNMAEAFSEIAEVYVSKCVSVSMCQ